MTPDTEHQRPPTTGSDRRSLVARISRLEWAVAAVAVAVMVGLAVAEPDILEAPFENERTIGFVGFGAVAAAVALILMLRLRVPPAIRVVVLGAPFVAVSWWLISPFFIDDVVNDDFETSIAVATGRSEPLESSPGTVAPTTVASNMGSAPTSTAATTAESSGPASPDTRPSSTSVSRPVGPALLGAGQFTGLAGHEGTGDAGIFRLDDGSHVLRLENFDIQNGPDLRLYLVPGADQTSPADGSLYLGALRGNVGNQTYELDADFVPTVGHWTVLVWCEAFSVEFVGASISIT
jgi:hypothetical protein